MSTEAKRRPGPRTKAPETRRTKRVMVMLTGDEYQRLVYLAHQAGLSMSEYLARPLRRVV